MLLRSSSSRQCYFRRQKANPLVGALPINEHLKQPALVPVVPLYRASPVLATPTVSCPRASAAPRAVVAAGPRSRPQAWSRPPVQCFWPSTAPHARLMSPAAHACCRLGTGQSWIRHQPLLSRELVDALRRLEAQPGVFASCSAALHAPTVSSGASSAGQPATNRGAQSAACRALSGDVLRQLSVRCTSAAAPRVRRHRPRPASRRPTRRAGTSAPALPHLFYDFLLYQN